MRSKILYFRAHFAYIDNPLRQHHDMNEPILDYNPHNSKYDHVTWGWIDVISIGGHILGSWLLYQYTTTIHPSEWDLFVWTSRPALVIVQALVVGIEIYQSWKRDKRAGRRIYIDYLSSWVI